MPSEASKNNRHFIGAGGDRIRNHGMTDLNLTNEDGGKMHSHFQVADVTRMLMSVSQICDNGCEVRFNAKQGWITDSRGKTVGVFKRSGGLYVAEMTLRSPKAHTVVDTVFFGRHRDPSPSARKTASIAAT